MSERYYDIRTADRVELDEIFREEVLDRIRTDVANVIDEVFEENDEIRWGKKKRAEIAEDVTKAVIDFVKRKGEFSKMSPVALVEFVDALGRYGWEILSPSRARSVRSRLGLFNIAVESTLTKRRKLVNNTRRKPRVKRLKETL